MPDIEGVPYETTGTPLDQASAQTLAARFREATSAGVAAGTEAKALAQSVVAEVGTIRTAVVQSANSASAAAGSAAQAQQTADALVPRVEHIETMAGLAPGEVTDAQTANLITQPDTSTRTALDAATVEVIEGGTDPQAIPTVKVAGDTRPGVWEYIHNSKSGYLYHLLAGPNFGGSAAIFAIGHDADDGTGAAILLAEKANGKGLVIDQRATKTAANAYGFYGTNRSTAASLVRLEQNAEGAAPALDIFSGVVAPGQIMAKFNNNQGNFGIIWADTGNITWKRQIVAEDPNAQTKARITAQQNQGVVNRSPVHHDHEGIEFRTYAGSATNYWPKRITHAGHLLRFQGAGTTNGVDTAPSAWVDAMSMEFLSNTPKIGFFGATPVAKPSAVPVTTEGVHAALVSLGLIGA